MRHVLTSGCAFRISYLFLLLIVTRYDRCIISLKRLAIICICLLLLFIISQLFRVTTKCRPNVFAWTWMSAAHANSLRSAIF